MLVSAYREIGGSDGPRSPRKTAPVEPQAIRQRGRNIQPGSSGFMATTGASLGTIRVKTARVKSTSISQPRPRTRKWSLANTPDTRPSSANSTLPSLPDTLTKDEWCFSWRIYCRKSSRDEWSFVILLKSYGLAVARSLARKHGWECEVLIAEAERRGF
jgi:hypothetical protein